MSTFWSLWVIFFTVVTFIGIFWLMWGNRSSLSRGANEPLEHSYDGIVEHDAPTPLWFYTLFIVLTLFAIGYLVFYTGQDNYPGLLGSSAAERLAKHQAAEEAEDGPIYKRYG